MFENSIFNIANQANGQSSSSGQPTLASGYQQFFNNPTSSMDAFRAHTLGSVMGQYNAPNGKVVQQLAGRADGEDGGAMGDHGYAQYNQGDGFKKGSGKFGVFGNDGKFSHMADFQDPSKGVAQWGPMVVAAMTGLGMAGMLGGGSAFGAGAGGAVGSGAGFVGEGALSGIPAWDGALAGATAAGGAGAGGISLQNIIKGITGGGGNGLGSMVGKLGLSGISSLLGGGGGANGGGGLNLGGMSMGDIIGLLGGGVDAYKQGDAAKKMLEWLNSNQAKMEGYMKPDSPEWKQMWDQMSRKDAAAGRNSQYGPRTVDFLSNVAKDKAQNTLNFTTGTSRGYSNALNQDASKYAGLSAAAQRAFGGGGPVNMSSILNALGSSSGSGSGMTNEQFFDLVGDEGMPIDYGYGMPDPTEDDVWDWINGGDLGQFF